VDNCRFKYYLKKHTVLDFPIQGQRLPEPTETVGDGGRGVGSPWSTPLIEAMSEADSDMGDEFAEFYRSLPN
jgi:hypothetical protein